MRIVPSRRWRSAVVLPMLTSGCLRGLAQIGWQEVGDTVVDRVALVALSAVERPPDDFVPLLLVDRELQLALAHRAGQDVHHVLAHIASFPAPGADEAL